MFLLFIRLLVSTNTPFFGTDIILVAYLLILFSSSVKNSVIVLHSDKRRTPKNEKKNRKTSISLNCTFRIHFFFFFAIDAFYFQLVKEISNELQQ